MAYFDIKVDCPNTILSLANGSNCTIACDSPLINNYYSPCVTCTGTLEVGCTIYYADNGAVANTGYYSDGIYCYYQSGGSIVSKTSCPSPTPQGPYTFEIFGSTHNTFYTPTDLGNITCSFQRYNSAGSLIATNIRYINYSETNGRPLIQGGTTTKSIISYSNMYSGDYIDVTTTALLPIPTGGSMVFNVYSEVGSHPIWDTGVTFGFAKGYTKLLGYYDNLSNEYISDKVRLVVGKHEVIPPDNYITANIMGSSYFKTACRLPHAWRVYVPPSPSPRLTRYVYKTAYPTITSITETLTSWNLNIRSRSTGSNNFVSEVGICFNSCQIPSKINLYLPSSTSTSTVTVGTGTKTFVISPLNTYYRYGDYLRFYAQGGVSAYMLGYITSYNSGTGVLIANITQVVTGTVGQTASSWQLLDTAGSSVDSIRYTGSIPFPSSGKTDFSYNISVPKTFMSIETATDQAQFRAYTIDAYGLAYSDPAILNLTGPPVIETIGVSNIFEITATLNGALVNANNGTVTAKGFQYSTVTPIPSNAPVISSNNAPATIGEYTGNLSGLTGNTTYYFKAYATNQYGTSYGETVEFKTAGPEFVYYTATAYYCPDCLTPSGTVTIRFSSTPAGSVYAFPGSVSYDLIDLTSGPGYDVDGDFLTQVGNCNIACSG